MAKTILHELVEFGQSAWLDYISRSTIDSGKLAALIEQGVMGVTSNPSIFNNAVSKSADYDAHIKEMASKGKSVFEIYDELTVRDIQDAADMFRPVWDRTHGMDGYISLEIDPSLAYDTDKTIAEGLRLHARVDRPNLMLKVPATDKGFPAVTTLISKGANVNITLIFSLHNYTKAAQAYLAGAEEYLNNNGDPQRVCSVASVFVSRVDTLVDTMLEEFIDSENDEDAINTLEALRGKAAVANAALIYDNFCDLQKSERFTALSARGIRLQRIVWGSTSTKNPEYSDIKYVTELIAKNTINTVPENTLHAFIDHGAIKETLTQNMVPAHKVITDLAMAGIRMNEVCATLLKDGVKAFEQAFTALLGSIEKKAHS
jgi:transaldolase